MRAATLSIGDELALGQIEDSNARWLAERLAREGIFRAEHRTVPDECDAILEAMRELLDRCDLLVATGGLGPTRDDLTRDALNLLVDGGRPMVEDAVARAGLDRMFRDRGRGMPASNLVQALRPASAEVIDNPNGTAPALCARPTIAGCTRVVWCLPGPPREMMPLVESAVVPELRRLRAEGGSADEVLLTGAVHAFGLGESALAERLGELMRRDAHPTVGTTASASIVTARVRARGPQAEAQAQIDATLDEITRRWHPYAYGRDGMTLAQATLAALALRDETLAVAESCTGGLLGAMLTDVSGSSAVVAGGWIVYSNDLKERALGVSRSTLAAHGAVSEPVAGELALAARSAARTSWGVGITGIAGPTGGSPAKPVGTVFIAIAGPERLPGGVAVRRFHFPGERATVRDRAAKSAVAWLRLASIGHGDADLLCARAEAPASERL